MGSIYGDYAEYLPLIMENFADRIRKFDSCEYEKNGSHIFEHFNYRIKDEESMREKCERQSLEPVPLNALRTIHDSIGFRIICLFRQDVFDLVEYFRNSPGCEVVEEKDYIRKAKPNGYRSYHLILMTEVPYPDIDGNDPGRYYVEVQLRTIAMDTWAALEHEIKYKQDIKFDRQDLITKELKRCADDLAACDVSMQTLRDLVKNDQ